MNWFKSILLMLVFVLGIAPMVHAHDHHHREVTSSELHEQVFEHHHACACHGCDKSLFCKDSIAEARHSTSSEIGIASGPLLILVLTRTETKILSNVAAPLIKSAPLQCLETIQLLI